MAFQSGTQIRPELANADLSGFQRAAEINAQMLAQLGQDIGEGIQSYQKNKQITSSSLAQIEGIAAANPDAYAALKQGGGDIAKSINNIEEGNYKQKDVLSVKGALDVFVSEKDRQRQINLEALEAQSKQQQIDQSAALFPAQQKAQELENKMSQAKLDAIGQPTQKPTASMANFAFLKSIGMPDKEALDRSFKSGGPQTVVNVGDQKETSVQKETGKNLAKELISPWLGGGGRDLSIGNLSKINEVVTGLQSGAIDTRTVTDFAPSLVRDTFRSLVNPSGQNAVDTVRDVVFQNLKNILGGAFSAKEAEELVSASYNPMLDEATNLERLMRTKDLMLKMIESKDALVSHLNSGGKMGDYDGIKPFDIYSAGKQNLLDMYGLSDQDSEIDSAVQDIAKKYQK